ncbi:hypothetical protein CPB84DRAFT_1708947 [Gymnopilus junonius]|uniref:Uncharacterized protein n=1 Tax=Gymnopilus junonius TaxID=109634 RepID=A0A9P5TMY7_GYMJU|nr:hypothetical protein CPB84DRAFT_1708947 [Gymnopilus junonius]
MISRYLTIFTLYTFLVLQTSASPTWPSITLQRRTDPVFPSSPPSCPICQQSYPNIQGCAEACPVLANFSLVIFNPGAFIDVIKCACTDTFQSVFPQCVDCFVQTNQTDVLDTSSLPSLVGDIKNVCGLESALLGNVSGVDASLTVGAPVPTTSASAGVIMRNNDLSATLITALGLFIGLVF